MIFCDELILDEAPRMTADGYLVATPRAARVGIQEYAGFEVGRPAMDSVRIYRPEAEVFADAALASMAHRPVTIDHPPVMVDAKNWKRYSRGMTGAEVVRDGEFVRVPMALMDQDGIDAVRKGKAQLSMGYAADLDWTPGTTPDGEAYDCVQRNIRGNHLAIVDTARGGPQLRVYDASTQEPEAVMPKQIVLDGITVEVSDTAAQVIEKVTKAHADETKTLNDAKAAAETALADAQTKLATAEAENATLKTQLEEAKVTPAMLDAAVAERAAVVDSAKKVLATVTVDSKSADEIRRQVVDARLGETAKGWTDAQVAASFAALCASGTKASTPPGTPPAAPVGDSNAAYQAMKDNLANAYKSKRA